MKTEERLQEVIGSRRAWRPLIATIAGAAAVAAVVIGAVLVTGPSTDPAPPAGGSSTTTLATTTTEVTTSAPTTTQPVANLPIAEPGMVVVADLDMEPVLDVGEDHIGYLAERVVGDGSGGVVVQLDGRLVRIERSGESKDLVNIADLGLDEPVTLELEDAVLGGPSPYIVYTVTSGSFAEPSQDVWIYDLALDESIPFYSRQEFESTIQQVSIAGGSMLLTIAEEGTTYFELLDSSGERVEFVSPVGLGTDFASPLVGGVLSPDGSTMAYAQIINGLTAEEGFMFVDIVQWDMRSGTEIERISLEFRDAEYPGRLDYDGTGIVLGRYLNLVDGPVPLTPLRIESLAEGTVTEVPVVGTPSLVKG